jgi:hypothetical protein
LRQVRALWDVGPHAAFAKKLPKSAISSIWNEHADALGIGIIRDGTWLTESAASACQDAVLDEIRGDGHSLVMRPAGALRWSNA